MQSALGALIVGCGSESTNGSGAGGDPFAKPDAGASDAGQSSNGDVDILIIGAGMAGLSAAAKIKANGGRTVRVLEARDRLGGRIHTDRSTGTAIDLGAAWVHYPTDKSNPLMGLLEGLGITPNVTKWDPIWVYDDVSGAINPTTFANGEASFEGAIKDASTVIKGLSNQNVSLASILEPKLSAIFTSAADLRLENFLRAFEIEDDYGAADSDIGAYAFSTYSATAGGNDQLVGGYDLLIQSLAAGIDVRLSTIVSKITYDASGVTVETSQGIFRAKKAIVTLPLGVLQAGSVTFDPPLPDDKTQAIGDIGFGHFEKVVLVYDSAFWTGTATTHGLGYASASTDIAPLLANLQAIAGVPALAAMTTGAPAISASKMSDDAIIAATEAQVTAMFGPHPAPKKALRTQWSDDPYALGAYSYPALPSMTPAIKALAAPVGTSLFFAGEATHTDWWSYVHGAYLSGVRAALEALT
jgi:monoamine oxidase